MINHEEIKNLVTQWELREDVIEKDYVIGWVLWGIGQEPELNHKWIFKGGTCLKKCYLETYRFSEDLDFTVLPDSPLKPDNIPYTWGEKAGNTLDCYWGMQAFAPWGLGTMVPLAVGREKMTDVAKARPKALKDKIEYEVQVDGPNTRKSVMPRNGTFIVDYEKVYKGGFVNGNRAGRSK